MTERVIIGDYGTCDGSWLVDTDGGNPRRRDGAAPVAVSPDGRKVRLLIADGELAIANPDGSAQTPVAGIPKAHEPTW